MGSKTRFDCRLACTYSFPKPNAVGRKLDYTRKTSQRRREQQCTGARGGGRAAPARHLYPSSSMRPFFSVIFASSSSTRPLADSKTRCTSASFASESAS